MDVLYTGLLGLLQGLTEFLPISSSGHLVLAKVLLGMESWGASLEVALHFGTAVSICYIYRTPLLVLLNGLLGATPASAVGSIPVRRYMFYLFLGIVPAGIAGLLARERLETIFQMPHYAALFLCVTGIFLLVSRTIVPRQNTLSWQIALMIGVIQIFALLPGISRSGITIVTALFCGVSREEAARFSFLTALPLILGAFFISLPSLITEYSGVVSFISLGVGIITACFAGIIAIRTVIHTLMKGQLYYFGIYCILIGVTAVFLFQ